MPSIEFDFNGQTFEVDVADTFLKRPEEEQRRLLKHGQSSGHRRRQDLPRRHDRRHAGRLLRRGQQQRFVRRT